MVNVVMKIQFVSYSLRVDERYQEVEHKVMTKPSETLQCYIGQQGRCLKKNKTLPYQSKTILNENDFKIKQSNANIKGYTLTCYVLLLY